VKLWRKRREISKCTYYIISPRVIIKAIIIIMTPTTALGLFIRLSIFELRETGDWHIFLGPQEWVRAETGGAGKQRHCPVLAVFIEITPASLGYPQSVFNKKL